MATQEDAEEEGEDEDDYGESSDESEEDDDILDPDAKQDNFVKGFLKDLLKVGPASKAILNYSYPPLLYHRGDDSEEGEGDMDGSESDEDQEEGMESGDSSHNQFGDINLDIMD